MTGEAHLLVIDPSGHRRRVPLRGRSLTVGRLVTNEVQVADAGVSRRHARIEPGDDGYLVEDLGSTNGTFVDGEILTAPRRLEGNEIIRFGRESAYSIVFRAREPRITHPADDGTGGAPESIACVPLMLSEQGGASDADDPGADDAGAVIGVLYVSHRRRSRAFAMGELSLLESLASQAAAAIDNARMYEEVERSHGAVVEAYETTLEGWAKALELRDQETEGHTRRVTELAAELGRRIGMSEEEIVQLRRGALLHDIGKLGVPDAVLLKHGPLDTGEWEQMREHPELARRWLEPIDFLQPAIEVPVCHHERWDGSGYPRGLAGEEIPLAARVFAVVDVWDAMTSDRPYRDALPGGQVLQFLREEAGRSFDPDVVATFLEMYEEGVVDEVEAT